MLPETPLRAAMDVAERIRVKLQDGLGPVGTDLAATKQAEDKAAAEAAEAAAARTPAATTPN